MGAETSKDGSKELTANSSVSKVIASVERIAPLAFAESWDNVGLLVEAPKPRQGAEAVFLTIDLTSWVLREAIQNPKIGYIVGKYTSRSHHLTLLLIIFLSAASLPPSAIPKDQSNLPG